MVWGYGGRSGVTVGLSEGELRQNSSFLLVLCPNPPAICVRKDTFTTPLSYRCRCDVPKDRSAAREGIKGRTLMPRCFWSIVIGQRHCHHALFVRHRCCCPSPKRS